MLLLLGGLIRAGTRAIGREGKTAVEDDDDDDAANMVFPPEGFCCWEAAAVDAAHCGYGFTIVMGGFVGGERTVVLLVVVGELPAIELGEVDEDDDDTLCPEMRTVRGENAELPETAEAVGCC